MFAGQTLSSRSGSGISTGTCIAEDEVMYIVQATSAGYTAGDSAVITINDMPVYCDKNEQNHFRGLHLVIFDPINLKVKSAEIFDTYISC